jgi:hypothetical protein
MTSKKMLGSLLLLTVFVIVFLYLIWLRGIWIALGCAGVTILTTDLIMIAIDMLTEKK